MANLEEIVADVQALLRQAPHARRGKLRVSPEFAAWLAEAPAGATAPTPATSGAEPAQSPTPRKDSPAAREPSGRFEESSPSTAPSTAPSAAPAAPRVAPAPMPALTGDREADLAALADIVSTCTKCALCETRKQTVFSDGSAHAEVMFVGEAPGADEDAQGVPFVGRAGQLLTRIIERVMKMKREEVYICNVIKCRPPGNRDPLDSEKAACLPYLSRQLELVKPKVIVALGRHAANTLLETDESIGRLRGRWHFYQGIPLRVTYHPAYILRCEGDPNRERSEKAKVKADIDEVLRVLSGEITPAPGNAGSL